MTAAMKVLRTAVFLRAKNACEGGCGQWVTFESAHLDHFFGRRNAESLETCWALCINCDMKKTLNEPSAGFWLRRFIIHATKYGYADARAWAETKISTLHAKGRKT